MVAVVVGDRCEPLRGHRGQVCGVVCHSAGGPQYSRGPLETPGRFAPLTGTARFPPLNRSIMIGQKWMMNARCSTNQPLSHVSSHQVDVGKHFLARVVGLILLPMLLYVAVFAVHFVVLNHR